MLRCFHIATTFRSRRKLRALWSQRKTKVAPLDRTNVVYRVHCSCSVPRRYTGKTVRRVRTRFDEHRKCIANSNVKGSALVEHVVENGCSFDFDNFSILSSDDNESKLLKKKAVFIQLTDNRINRNAGCAICEGWKEILNLVPN